MQGYDNTSYGEAFADVYDDWYGEVSDTGATVEALARLAAETGSRPIVELGVGTGRIALPLAERVRPVPVWGIDSSPSMLAVLAAKRPPATLHVYLGDMVDALAEVCPGDEIGVVFVAFNTFFNLESRDLQQRCLLRIADRLGPGGCLVIEAFVPDEPARHGDDIEIRSLRADRVVLSIARYGADQHVEGQFVELSESGSVRLRPWSIRYVGLAELDAMTGDAGLTLRSRWTTFAGDEFDEDSDRHVSVYVKAG